MMLRLAILSSHPIQYFSPLYRALTQSDVDVTVFYLCRQGLEQYKDVGFKQTIQWDVPLLDGYKSQFLTRATEMPTFLNSLRLPFYRTLNRDNFDAILVYGHQYGSYLWTLFRARLQGLPILLRCETHLGLKRSFGKQLLFRALIGSLYRSVGSAFLAIGSRNAAYYRWLGIDSRKIFLAPYSVDNVFFQSKAAEAKNHYVELREGYKIPTNAVVILYASKFIDRKRPLDLLHAFVLLSQRHENVFLLMVGAGPLASELREFADLQGLKNIIFTGFQNQSKLPSLFAVSDIFVLPSENEPWGLIINEAMCAGMPIITTDEVGAAADLVRSGDNGFIYPTGDTDRLCHFLDVLVMDDALRQKMGLRSRAVIQDWGLDATVAGFKAALDFA
jgi:glycosyltransferase involved in cell wall biosynthesis